MVIFQFNSWSVSNLEGTSFPVQTKQKTKLKKQKQKKNPKCNETKQNRGMFETSYQHAL